MDSTHKVTTLHRDRTRLGVRSNDLHRYCGSIIFCIYLSFGQSSRKNCLFSFIWIMHIRADNGIYCWPRSGEEVSSCKITTLDLLVRGIDYIVLYGIVSCRVVNSCLVWCSIWDCMDCMEVYHVWCCVMVCDVMWPFACSTFTFLMVLILSSSTFRLATHLQLTSMSWSIE